jgi:hypothetical protein
MKSGLDSMLAEIGDLCAKLTALGGRTRINYWYNWILPFAGLECKVDVALSTNVRGSR